MMKIKNANRLKYSAKQSFKEKIKTLKQKYGKISKMDEKSIKELIKNQWIETIKNKKYETRNTNYEEISEKNLKYNEISQSRKLNKLWLQARLGVIPTNEFLKSINKSKDEKCRKCGQIETLEHILIECNFYENIRTNIIRDIKVLLNPDRPPPEKVRTAQFIAEVLKNRKRGRCL